ncbi:MAG TPA: hypothetical protein VHY34_06250 [Caulobacteraceae bacterium]|jgi:hypothetical protein|nr:hypothetical protein [Caulobacteraceae bacterium]
MTEERRKAERRRTVRRRNTTFLPESLAPAVVESEPSEPLETRPRRGGSVGFAAQILGQGGGQKRGLKGGPETLDRARATYLGAEWSGPADRRPRPGRITKTEV